MATGKQDCTHLGSDEAFMKLAQMGFTVLQIRRMARASTTGERAVTLECRACVAKISTAQIAAAHMWILAHTSFDHRTHLLVHQLHPTSP